MNVIFFNAGRKKYSVVSLVVFRISFTELIKNMKPVHKLILLMLISYLVQFGNLKMEAGQEEGGLEKIWLQVGWAGTAKRVESSKV